MKKKNDEKKSSSNEKSEHFKCTICKKNTHTTEICYKNPSNGKTADNSEKKATANALRNHSDECDNNSTEFQIWMDSEN